MADTRGTFRLINILSLKMENESVPLDEVWISPSPFIALSPDTGYFGGGDPSTTIMDKVTYASDTTAAVPSANLSLARYALAATGNSTHGYFGGGDPGPRSTMDKVTYASDTAAAVPSANLSATRYYLAATGNQTAGYFGSGKDDNSDVTTIDKVTYASDTRAAVPGAALSVRRFGLAATGNSTHGYFGGGGGGDPGFLSTIDKITYSNDTRSTVPSSGNLSAARNYLAASSARANGLPTNAPIPTPVIV